MKIRAGYVSNSSSSSFLALLQIGRQIDWAIENNYHNDNCFPEKSIDKMSSSKEEIKEEPTGLNAEDILLWSTRNTLLWSIYNNSARRL